MLLLLLLLLLLAYPAAAVYAMDGVSLHTVAHGKHHGVVSVTGGHGLAASPYTQSFTAPVGTVRFARLYVGVWGGNPDYTGTVETSLNGASLGGRALGGGSDTNSMTYVGGFGVHWCAYDVTGRVRAGANSATATTAGGIDGRVYGMVLAVATEDPSAPEIEYWFAEGNENLNQAAGKNSASLALGAGPSPSSVADARLYASYVASMAGDGDLLLFNGQTITTDAAAASSGAYFDLRTYDVRSKVRDTATIGFGRGGATRLHPTFIGYVVSLAAAPTSSPTIVPTTLAAPSTAALTTAPAVAVTTLAAITAPPSPTTTGVAVSAATSVTQATAATTALTTLATLATEITTFPTTATTTESTTSTTTPTALIVGIEPVVVTGSPGAGDLPPNAAQGSDRPEDAPTSTINASVAQGPGGGSAPIGAGSGPGSLEAVLAMNGAEVITEIILFALVIGAGILVFSVITGAGLASYRFLSRAGEGRGASEDRTKPAGPAKQPTAPGRFVDDE